MIYNGTQGTIVVRPFAAGHLVAFTDLIQIESGQAVDQPSIFLPALERVLPYQISHQLLVRDWGPPQGAKPLDVPMVVLKSGKARCFKASCSLDCRTYEGYLIAFLADADLIRFWCQDEE